MKLFLKGERRHTAKCAIAKRGDAFPPGGRAHQARSRLGNTGNQLREKQRLKRYFGLLDRQFRARRACAP
jgi:small subunit ribosomal protein S4